MSASTVGAEAAADEPLVCLGEAPCAATGLVGLAARAVASASSAHRLGLRVGLECWWALAELTRLAIVIGVGF